MNKPDNKILLAFLLALKDLKEQDYFSNDEKTALKTVGMQLELDANNWEYIQESIKDILEVNNTFRELYQKNINKINKINFETILSLLPTPDELKEELQLPKDIYEEVRGYFEIEPGLESNGILNVTIVIFRVNDPIVTAKKLSFLKRVENFLASAKKLSFRKRIENFINKIKPRL
jgi:hypothetical protein